MKYNIFATKHLGPLPYSHRPSNKINKQKAAMSTEVFECCVATLWIFQHSKTLLHDYKYKTSSGHAWVLYCTNFC